MTSRLLLFIHLVLVLLIVICGLSAPVVALLYPNFFVDLYFPVVETCIITTMLSWPFFHGMCFMTQWENRLLRREGRRTYRGGCMDHYSRLWFGWTPPKGAATALIFTCSLVPVVARILL